ADGKHWLRHALLAEAVAAELLPSERVSLHERVAQALQGAGGDTPAGPGGGVPVREGGAQALRAAGDDTLAAEAAGHWAAAGRKADELYARLTAARAAAQVFAYADAAAHWQRATRQ